MSDQVLDAVLELKGDVGEVKAKLTSIETWLTNHSAEDRAAHARITSMELRHARSRGAASVWHMVTIGGATLAGYLGEVALTWFRQR